MGGEDDSGTRERRDRMAAIARSLEREFAGRGFALLVFDKAPRDGRVSYVSNCGRADVLEAMRRQGSRMRTHRLSRAKAAKTERHHRRSGDHTVSD